jgi:hypothetical protein
MMVGLYDELTPASRSSREAADGVILGGWGRYKVTEVMISRDSAPVARIVVRRVDWRIQPAPARGRA